MAALLGLAWVLVPADSGGLRGTARVIDGDTFDLGSTRIRVFGIDAPEAATPMGPRATAWLAARLDGREVRCVRKDTDRYGRTVATCYLGGQDVAEAMVREGWAEAYRRFSGDYIDEEEAARAARRGIWAVPVALVRGENGCAIKGNISASGRVYHLPGTRDYDMTKIDTARGERWFCSEADARAAGWRAVGE